MRHKKVVTKKQAIEAWKKTITDCLLSEDNDRDREVAVASSLLLLSRLFELFSDEQEELVIYAAKVRATISKVKKAVEKIKKDRNGKLSCYNHNRGAKMTEWISVKHPPQFGVKVLTAIFGSDMIYCNEGETIDQARERLRKECRRVSMGYRDEDGEWIGADGYPEIVRPSYWMPLPELPES